MVMYGRLVLVVVFVVLRVVLVVSTLLSMVLWEYVCDYEGIVGGCDDDDGGDVGDNVA